MNTFWWLLALLGAFASAGTFVLFAGGALVAWIADMQRERWGDE